MRLRRGNTRSSLQKRKTHISTINNDVIFNEKTTSSILKYIYYGNNNTYPNDVKKSIERSPTAKGCVHLKKDYTFGLGVEGADDIVVNRDGLTLNEVIETAVSNYSMFQGYVLHFNFNVFGEIIEIQNVPFEFVRKHKDLTSAFYGTFDGGFGKKDLEFPLYNSENFKKEVKEKGGIKKHFGQLYYFKNNGHIYPLSNIHASFMSVKFEDSLQTFNYANIENGFSGSGILQIPHFNDDDEKVDEYEEKVKQMKGSKNAGSIIVISSPADLDGKANTGKLYESFSLPSVDKLYTNQERNAKINILEEFMAPEILLGVSNDGMFNQESFLDASDYYNKKTEADRQIIEKSINKFWEKTIFSKELKEIKINPLEIDDARRNSTNNLSGSPEG